MNSKLFAVAAVVAVAFTSVGSAYALSIKGPIRRPNTAGIESTYECGNELSVLRRVYEDQLWSVIDEDRVAVTPLCEGERSLRGEGNVGTLRPILGDNPALLAALLDADYLPEEVVGVRMTGEGKVTLYVQHS